LLSLFIWSKVKTLGCFTFAAMPYQLIIITCSDFFAPQRLSFFSLSLTHTQKDTDKRWPIPNYQLTFSIYAYQILLYLFKHAAQPYLPTLASIEILISAILSYLFTPLMMLHYFVCKHFVFIKICVSWHSIFSNKVDLSQVTSVLNWTKSVCWKKIHKHRHTYTYKQFICKVLKK